MICFPKNERICSTFYRIQNATSVFCVTVVPAVPPPTILGIQLQERFGTVGESPKAKEKNYQTTQIYGP